MLSAILTLSLACSRGGWEDSNVPSANGRFTLEVTAPALTLLEKGAVRWRLDAPQRQSQYRVSDSGAWVAELVSSECIDCEQLVLYGPEGKSVARVKLLNLLSEEEQQFLGRSTCGVHWLSKATVAGDSLELEIRQGGNVPPIYDQGPTLRFTVNARTGAVVRAPPVPRPSISELLEEYRTAADDRARRFAFQELMRKAMLASSRGNRPLAEFLLTRVQSKDSAYDRQRAAELLGNVGTEADLKALAALRARGDEGDTGVLAALEKHAPTEAQPYALQALREKRPPELLRLRSVVLLVKDGGASCWEAAALGLVDPSERVRDDTVYEVTRLPRSQRAWDLLLPVAAGNGRARMGLLGSYLDNPDDPTWRSQLSTAVAAGKLDRWGGALVIAGAMAEVRGDAAAAVALYQRGLKVLAGERPKQGWFAEATLWCEAKLRLAQLAANAKRPEEAVRLANEVVASGYSGIVSAPSPSRYGGGKSGFQSAQAVAKQLISTKGAPLPPPYKPPDHGAMMRQMEEQMKMMRAQQAARDAAAAARAAARDGG